MNEDLKNVFRRAEVSKLRYSHMSDVRQIEMGAYVSRDKMSGNHHPLTRGFSNQIGGTSWVQSGS